MTFSDLGLVPELLRAVADKGYATPTPIQLAAIPAVLSGRDVLAGAQTGTGKTAGFVLPLLQKLARREGREPRCLVLTPTRELAAQVAESARDYGRHLDLRTQVIFGGVSERPQIEHMRQGCDVLVATPGRLLDLAQQKLLSLASVRHFVLDEADRMLDMGFIRDIRRVIAMLPAVRQNLLFSATYSDDIRDLASRLLRDPVAIQVTPRNATAERVEQTAYRVPKEHKRHLLAHLIREGAWQQVLVFTRTKHGANRLAEQLDRAGIASAAIHGNKSQGARVRALEDFKASRIVALVATEVAARGLDIKELPHVVNFELPNVPEDYVHRIGRTARAGAAGAAVSLVSPDEAPLLKDIVRLLKRDLPFTPTPQFSVAEPPPRAQPADTAGRAPPARQPGRRPGAPRTPERARDPARALHDARRQAQAPRRDGAGRADGAVRGGRQRRDARGGGGSAGAAAAPAGRFSRMD